MHSYEHHRECLANDVEPRFQRRVRRNATRHRGGAGLAVRVRRPLMDWEGMHNALHLQGREAHC